jgi:tetratricopeptide (TPR) repeat protein
MEDLATQASVLIGSGRLVEAISFLRQAIEESLNAGEIAEAAYGCNLLGSCLAAAGRDDEALGQYLRAEDLEPGNPFLKMQTATFLLDFMNRPQAALEKLAPELDSFREPSSDHAVKGLLGSIYLELGRIAEAEDALRGMTQQIKALHPRGLDFRLVTRLIERKLLRNLCREYLELVISRAKTLDELSIQRDAQALLSAI